MLADESEAKDVVQDAVSAVVSVSAALCRAQPGA